MKNLLSCVCVLFMSASVVFAQNTEADCDDQEVLVTVAQTASVNAQATAVAKKAAADTAKGNVKQPAANWTPEQVASYNAVLKAANDTYLNGAPNLNAANTLKAAADSNYGTGLTNYVEQDWTDCYNDWVQATSLYNSSIQPYTAATSAYNTAALYYMQCIAIWNNYQKKIGG